MNAHRTPHRIAAIAAAVVATATLAVPGLAAAADVHPAASVPAPSAEPTTDLPPRLVRACLRVTNLQIRTDNLRERLNGDASTRGSLLWLEAKIEQARDRGRDDLVAVLENRMAVRQATLPVLDLRSAALVEIAARCSELGVEL